jgi:tRNA(Ile)-lysidine synthase
MNIDLTKYLKKGDKVAVAVSGGRDSMCLLHYLYNNCSDNKVFAINVEHGIRGQSSRNDSKFVKDYCEKLNIKLYSYTVNAIEYQKNNKVTVEEAARILRYDCFKDLIDKNTVDYIAVAHHITDQCETIFMRLMRGTGIYGLTGITDKRDYIIRPFLNVSRDEIDEYVKINNIPYIKDETNDDNSYTRNFIRNEVFPLLDKKFMSYKQSLVRLQRTASEYIDLLESMSAEIIKEGSETAKIKIDDLKGFKALSNTIY